MALKKTGVELVAEDASKFYAELDKANNAVTTFGRDAEKAGGGVSAFGTIATGALLKVGMVAVDMGLQAGKAIAGFVSDSVSVAADYESSLNRFASVAGDAVADAGMAMSDFSDLALEMGAKTQYSAGEAADAMVELAKGGLDPATIAAGGLEGALSLAAAGELDLSEAANITAKQLGVWSDQGVTAAQVADRMAQAANASTVDVDDLAMGMANVGGVAKIAGLSFDETTQTLALLAPGFSSAADASTSFKTFLQRLIPTTKPATEAMIDLGLATEDGASKFYDANGAFIGMQAAAQLLQEKTAGLSEEERLLAFNTIFGADAIRAASLVAEGGAAGFDAMGASMTAAGTASEQAAKRNQGFSFAMESLRGSIETVQIVLGTMLLPILTTLITDYVTPVINGVLALVQAFGAAGDKTAFLTASIETILPGFTAVWDSLMAGVDTITQAVLPILDSLAAWFAGPGIDVIREYADYYIANWKQIYGIVQAILPSILSIVQTVMAAISTFIERHGQEIITTLRGAWESIREIVQLALNLIKAIIVPTLQVIASFIAAHKDQIVALLEGAWMIIKNLIEGTLTLIKGILQAALQLIQGDWRGAWDTIVATLTEVWENIKGILQGAVTVVTSILQVAWDAIIGAATVAWNAVKGAIEGPLLAAQATVNAVIATIIGYINGAIAKINALIALINSIPGVNIPSVPTIGGTGSKAVTPPASPTQQYGASSQSSATTNNWTYAPTYGGAPPAPAQNFAIMQALVR